MYRTGRITSAMRLLHAQAPISDDRKLSEYSIPEGSTISALFEPDVDINIEVNIGHKTQKLTVPNSTSAMVLKVQIRGVMRCGVAPEKLEIRLGDVTLEDLMPLHFYGVKNESTLSVLKPYVIVSIEDNHGDVICKRLNRKDTIQEVKVKLSSSTRSPSPIPIEDPTDGTPPGPPGHFPGRRGHHHHFHHARGMRMRQLIQHTQPMVVARHPSVDDMRLYIIKVAAQGAEYEELADELTVKDYSLTDNDRLYLLSYQWVNQATITVTTQDRTVVRGVRPNDTVLSVKVRTQDQLGLSVSQVRLQSYEN